MDTEKKHGGARSGAGRKKKPISPDVAQRALARIGEENAWVEQYKKALKSSSTGEAVRILTILRRFGYGDPVATVNHLHDKPIDVNLNVTLGERMKTAMAKADERLKGK